MITFYLVLIATISSVFLFHSQDYKLLDNSHYFELDSKELKPILILRKSVHQNGYKSIDTLKLEKGTYKIIDLNGKVLFDTKEDDIDFLRKDDQEKRIYSFDNGKTSYNYKRELIKNNEI